MNSITLTKIIFQIIVVMEIFILTGCSSDNYQNQSGGNKYAPKCDFCQESPPNPHKFNYDWFYMSGYPLFHAGNSQKVIDAFWRKTYIRAFQKVVGNQVPYSSISIPQGGGEYQAIIALNTWINSLNYPARDSINFQGTAYSIKEVINFDSVIGYTQHSSHNTFIFTGRILGNYAEDTTAVIACLVHELGHNMGIYGHEEGCGGCDSIHCIMNINDTFYFQYHSNIHFCNSHGCTIYNNTLPSGMGASNVLKYFFENTTNTNLECTIEINKIDLLECQPLYVTLKIKNNSDINDTLYQYKYFKEYFNIINSKGEKIKYHPDNEMDYVYHYLIITPNEEKSFEINLLENYGTIFLDSVYDSKLNIYNPIYQYLKAEKYNITFNGFKNISNSNKIHFEITQPSGKDLEDLNTIKKTIGMLSARDKINSFYNFLINNDSSLYYDLAFEKYCQMGGYLEQDDFDNFFVLAEKYICNQPNSPLIREPFVALSVAKNKGSNYQKLWIKRFLDKIINNYPNTMASEQASILIKYK